MPIPLILGGVAVTSAAAGVMNIINANKNTNNAKKNISDALNIAEIVVRRVNQEKLKTNKCFEILGAYQIDCQKKLINRFVSSYRKIGNIDRKESQFGLISINASAVDIDAIQLSNVNAIDYLKTGGNAIAAGAATGWATAGMAGAIGVASTGTAISGLSGAAASNATLAWLGGGSLATGGAGIAGGTAVLGGIIAGPALLVAGLLASKKSEELLTKSESEISNIALGVEQNEDSILSMKAIQARTLEVYFVTKKIAESFESILLKIEALLSQKESELAVLNHKFNKLNEEYNLEYLEQVNSYKKINVFKRFFNWIFGRRPVFEKKSAPLFDNPLSFEFFSDDEKKLFMYFVDHGAKLHSALKVEILEATGAVSDVSKNFIAESGVSLNGY